MNNFQQPGNTSNLQMPETIQNFGNSVSDSVQSISGSVSESVNSFSDSAQASVDTTMEGSSDFLQSNTLFAKFAFVILVVIVFMILLSLGIVLIQYFSSPSKSPYLVKGMAEGNGNLTISQDPQKSDSVTIQRSNNEKNGLEFTWSTWIYVDDLNSGVEYQKFQHIFHKGNDSFDAEGIANVSNAPGLYLKQIVSSNESEPNTASLFVVMDSNTGQEQGRIDNHENTMEIKNIPLKKWVCVILRMKNTILETYVNGVVAGRLQFKDVPLQNYYDVHVGKNGGINGKISNLQYHSEALTIFDINNLVSSGPDIRTLKTNIQVSSNYNYLSNLWYSSKLY
tara:strand:+ start:308 stop:1321 length:1014 start_codon:yes stop_codon:yes gene_type:complete